MKDNEIAEKYGVSERTVQNWNAKGVECGVLVPWGDPAGLLEWYRGQMGRQPGKKLRERVAELLDEPVAADDSAEVLGEVLGEVVPVVGAGGVTTLEVIERVCQDLGLGSTLARIIEEEERCWKDYEKARQSNNNLAGARKDWKEATEAKRAVHKTDDAVQVALHLLKQWTRGEWEARWKKLKLELSGGRLGLEAREDLMNARSEADFAREWDKAMERVIAGWAEEYGE